VKGEGNQTLFYESTSLLLSHARLNSHTIEALKGCKSLQHGIGSPMPSAPPDISNMIELQPEIKALKSFFHGPCEKAEIVLRRRPAESAQKRHSHLSFLVSSMMDERYARAFKIAERHC
jgi:hypothetical protein